MILEILLSTEVFEAGWPVGSGEGNDSVLEPAHAWLVAGGSNIVSALVIGAWPSEALSFLFSFLGEAFVELVTKFIPNRLLTTAVCGRMLRGNLGLFISNFGEVVPYLEWPLLTVSLVLEFRDVLTLSFLLGGIF